jgi:hypothetical protein
MPRPRAEIRISAHAAARREAPAKLRVMAAVRAASQAPPHGAHDMWGLELGRGWQLMGMAQGSRP